MRNISVLFVLHISVLWNTTKPWRLTLQVHIYFSVLHSPQYINPSHLLFQDLWGHNKQKNHKNDHERLTVLKFIWLTNISFDHQYDSYWQVTRNAMLTLCQNIIDRNMVCNTVMKILEHFTPETMKLIFKLWHQWTNWNNFFAS